jgi:hypothetical protein
VGEGWRAGTAGSPAGGLEIVAQVGGSSFDVASDGRTVYLGQGPRVVVVDVPAGSAPVPAAASEVLAGVVHGLALTPKGRRLLAAAGRQLVVLDAAPGAAPAPIATLDVGAEARDVVVEGDTVYVAVDGKGLTTVDVSDPARPRRRGAVGVCDELARLAVHEGIVAAACGDAGLVVVDASNPAWPRVVGRHDVADEVTDVALRWPYAYTGDAYRPHVVDLSDPARPREVDTLDDVSGEHVALDGTRLLLAGTEGLFVFDLSEDPTGPRLMGSMPMSEPGWEGVLPLPGSPDRLLLPRGGNGGLDVVDVADPARPAPGGTYDALGMAGAVAAGAGRVHAVEFYSNTVHSWATSAVTAPLAAGVVVPGIRAWGIAADGTQLLAAEGWESATGYGLSRWDLADPARPQPRGTVSGAQAYAFDVVLAGRLAFVQEVYSQLGGGSVGIVDVSDPARLRHLGSLPQTAQNVADVAASADGRYLYLAEDASEGDVVFSGGDGRLEVVDIRDPAHPAVVGSVTTPRQALGVAAAGRHALVAAGDAGLRVIDAADAARPRELAALGTPGSAYDVVVDGDTAYVGYSGGLLAVDVTDPAAPRVVQDLPLPGEARSLALDRDASGRTLVWIAGEDAGLLGVLTRP